MSQIDGKVFQAAAGVLGFDTTEVLNAVSAKNYINKGYKFCVRYIGRAAGKSNFVDIGQLEAQMIVDAGLALTVVQHPLAAGWVPTESMGSSFGNYAALAAGKAGLLPGTNVWLDLEGVKDGVSADDVIAYCNAWFEEVDGLSFASGVYIGASPGLTADQLYWDLKTKHYWKGGSSAKAGVPDDIPNRGYQLVQRISNPGTPSEFDSNVTRTDAFGSGVMWIASTDADAMVCDRRPI
jgi:Domain of unknown function (DUF1906)